MKTSSFYTPANFLLLVLVICLIPIFGCDSVELQQRRFVEDKNYETGSPFYAHEKKGMRETILDAKTSEFAPENLPPSGCAVAWLVDTTTRGDYLHPNGYTFQIEGVKKSWRFVGDPSGCRVRINWGGPW